MNIMEPKNAVNIPRGISPGSNERARSSQIMLKMAPNPMLIGMVRWLSAPVMIRARFGMINPTQLMMPDTEMTAEVIKTAANKTTVNSQWFFNPKEKATSLSSAWIFNLQR